MSKYRVKIARKLSSDLMFRGVADSFFDEMERLPESRLVFDFADVRSISRSFADQYSNRKSKSSKVVIEVNKTREVQQMLDLVVRPSSGSRVKLPPFQKPQLIAA